MATTTDVFGNEHSRITDTKDQYRHGGLGGPIGHEIVKCSCGTVIAQCRCIGPHNTRVVVKGCAFCMSADQYRVQASYASVGVPIQSFPPNPVTITTGGHAYPSATSTATFPLSPEPSSVTAITFNPPTGTTTIADHSYPGSTGQVNQPAPKRHPFEYVKPTIAQGQTMAAINAKLKAAYDLMEELVPASAEHTLATRKLQECRMWINAAIVLN